MAQNTTSTSTSSIVVKYQAADAVAPLHHQYEGQAFAQPAYIALDLDDGTLCADWNAEIGGGTDHRVFEGRRLEWDLHDTYLSADAVNTLLDQLVPYANKIVSGYSCRDGRGCLTDAASDVSDAASRLVYEYRGAELDDYVADSVGDFADWMGCEMDDFVGKPADRPDADDHDAWVAIATKMMAWATTAAECRVRYDFDADDLADALINSYASREDAD